MLKVKDVARKLGVSQHTVGIYIRNGDLQAIDVSRKPGGKPVWRIRDEDLEAFQLARMSTPPAPVKRRQKRTDSGVVEFY